MTAPTLSVTVLNYNYGHYLAGCLQSILDQSFSDFELIVIDDCSQDNSLEVVRPFLSDPRVRLVAHERNAGFVPSLVEGTEVHSRGEFLMVISADDLVIDRHAFAYQIALLRRYPRAAFASSGYERFAPGVDPEPRVSRYSEREAMFEPAEAIRGLLRDARALPPHSGTMIRRTAYEACGGYRRDIRMAVDVAIWTALALEGGFAYTPRVFYRALESAGHMSGSSAGFQRGVRELDLVLRDACEAAAAQGIETGGHRGALGTHLGMAALHDAFSGNRRSSLARCWVSLRECPRATLTSKGVWIALGRSLTGERTFRALRTVARAFTRAPKPPRPEVMHVAVSEGVAGTEKVIAMLAHDLAAAGHAAAVVLPTRAALDDYAAELRAGGVQVYRAGDLFARDRGVIRSFWTFWRLFRRVRPEVAHFHIPWAPTAWEAVIAARLAGVRLVMRTEHNPIPHALSRRTRLKMRVTDSAVHHIAFVSAGNAEKHLSNGRGWLRQWSVIPNGIPAASSDPVPRAEACEAVGIPDDAMAAVMVGRLEQRKGPLDFVRAAAAAVAAGLRLHFVVLGDGPLRHEAEGLANELGVGDRVHFAGHRAGVRQLLPAFDIFVQPSHYEGLSIAMLEALDAGLPMVTTAVEGVSDVLGDGRGALVTPVGDTAALADSILRLERNPEERAALAAVTRTRVETAFSASAMCRGYDELYRRLRKERTDHSEEEIHDTPPPHLGSHSNAEPR